MSSGRANKNASGFISDWEKKKHADTAASIAGDRTPPPGYSENASIPDSRAPGFYDPLRPSRYRLPDNLSEVLSPVHAGPSSTSRSGGQHTSTKDNTDSEKNEKKKHIMPGQFPGEEMTTTSSHSGAKKSQDQVTDDEDKEEEEEVKEALRYETAKKVWTAATDRRFNEYEDELEVKPEDDL